MLYHNPRTASVIADSHEVELVTLSRPDLTKVLGDDLSRIIYINTLRFSLETSKINSMITKEQLEFLIA